MKVVVVGATGTIGTKSDVDAVICCAASAPLTSLTDPAILSSSTQSKLFGQVELVRQAIEHVRDGGSITLTSGKIPEATRSRTSLRRDRRGHGAGADSYPGA